MTDILSGWTENRATWNKGALGTQAWYYCTKRGITARLKRDIRRRSAIEPAIGHMKNDSRLRNSEVLW